MSAIWDGEVAASEDGRLAFAEAYQRVRADTERLCQPLQTEDYQLQSIVQTSPPKWHIAHVSWFFETFVLVPFATGYQVFDPHFDFLFNSYYYTHGKMHPRAERGLLSRPGLEDVYRYRRHVDAALLALLDSAPESLWATLNFRVTLGLHHEQQHQELLLMDIKHNFSANPLLPAYRKDLASAEGALRATRWHEFAGGQVEIGAQSGFAFDNETPRHAVLLRPFRLADRLVSNQEYQQFIEAGGYRDPALWLADGWALLQEVGWQSPLYWRQIEGEWCEYTLGGLRTLQAAQPVCHLSFYEADAYARWAGKRLPSEAELETALESQPLSGNFREADLLHPAPAGEAGQWFGDLWAWTSSPYSAYPGFKPLEGAMGEYNGKFMSNQMVLRGGACVTPREHVRASYRNFFYPNERWAFTGLRLAEDA